MQPVKERMASAPLDTLIVRCYPGQNGDHNSYTLYEDDGLTTDYQKGKFATTILTYSKKEEAITVTINKTTGKFDGQPSKRAYIIELPEVGQKAKVRINGKRTKTVYDTQLDGLKVPIKKTSINKDIIVQIN